MFCCAERAFWSLSVSLKKKKYFQLIWWNSLRVKPRVQNNGEKKNDFLHQCSCAPHFQSARKHLVCPNWILKAINAFIYRLEYDAVSWQLSVLHSCKAAEWNNSTSIVVCINVLNHMEKQCQSKLTLQRDKSNFQRFWSTRLLGIR